MIISLKKPLIPVLAALAATVSLSACDQGYGSSRVAVGWSSPYAYDTYYDGTYGPIYDGYWGGDGGFWYRNAETGRYRRGDGAHFRRDMPGDRGNWGGRNWQRYQGTINAPPAHTRMPHFPNHNRH